MIKLFPYAETTCPHYISSNKNFSYRNATIKLWKTNQSASHSWVPHALQISQCCRQLWSKQNEKVFVSKENLATVSKHKNVRSKELISVELPPRKYTFGHFFQDPFTCLRTFTRKAKARVKLRTSSHRPDLIKVCIDLQYKVRIAWVKQPNSIQLNFGGKSTSRDFWALTWWTCVWKSYFELRSEA